MPFIIIGRSIDGACCLTESGTASQWSEAQRFPTRKAAIARMEEEKARNLRRDPDSIVGRLEVKLRRKPPACSPAGTNLSDGHGWQMSTSRLKAAFGIESRKDWNPAGHAARMIGNVLVWVKPRREGHGHHKRHRAMAMCPACTKTVPAGRLHQHLTIHQEG